LQNDYSGLYKEMKRVADQVNKMIAEPIKDSCDTCGQALEGESLQKAEAHKENLVNKRKLEGKTMHNDLKALKVKIESLEAPGDIALEDVSQYQEKYYALQSKIESFKRVASLEEQVGIAEANKAVVRTELLNARGIIDSIKVFNTLKSEMMVEKVNELLDTLTIKLFDLKKNGNITPTFEVMLDGKPYSKLSTAEKIKAGLELAEVLIIQSGVSIPVFVDNAESILKFTAPSAQLITAKVKAGELKIETKGEIK
jgi:hypothetical protein